jgi:hypothetical protein
VTGQFRHYAGMRLNTRKPASMHALQRLVRPGDVVATAEQVFRVEVVFASETWPVVPVLVRPIALAIAAA